MTDYEIAKQSALLLKLGEYCTRISCSPLPPSGGTTQQQATAATDATDATDATAAY